MRPALCANSISNSAMKWIRAASLRQENIHGTQSIRLLLALLAGLPPAAAERQQSVRPRPRRRIVDPIAVPAYVTAALADPERAMHQPTDARRHPAELIAFSGLKAGDRVLDLIPGDGYCTRMFSRIVGPEGRVYAVWPQAYADVAQGNVRTLEALAATPHYANIGSRWSRPPP